MRFEYRVCDSFLITFQVIYNTVASHLRSASICVNEKKSLDAREIEDDPWALNNSDTVTLVGDGRFAAVWVGVGVDLFLQRGCGYTGCARGWTCWTSTSGGWVSGKKVIALTAEPLHQESLDLVLPDEDYEDYDTLQGVCQIGYVPDGFW